MTSRRKRVVVGLSAGVLALGLIGTVGVWAWAKRPRELPPLETVLPEFEPLDQQSPLARAPSSEAFGVRIGAITPEQLLEQLDGRGLTCDETGIRASIEKLREYKRKQLAEAEDPDAVSGASILWRRSKKETNPQVRLACELDSIAMFQPGHPDIAGRALFVFDSPEHPLRHASLRRTYLDNEAAMLDVRETVARFQLIYGAPTTVRGSIPAAGEAPAKPEPIRVQWRFADLFVEVSATRFGKMVSVDERVEVPWPTRADAPTL